MNTSTSTARNAPPRSWRMMLILVLCLPSAAAAFFAAAPPSSLTASISAATAFSHRRGLEPVARKPMTALRFDGGVANEAKDADDSSLSSSSLARRRSFLQFTAALAASSIISVVAPPAAMAAPPFAIMAEEMGYFPVKDERTGEDVMVPARVKRESTDQALALAEYLKGTGATMYGAFWCPHCSRQKELFGSKAWSRLTYIECSPKGYRAEAAVCLASGIEGYPSWKFGNGKVGSGEMELAEIAQMSGFVDSKGRMKKGGLFDASLETGVPPLGGGSCGGK